MKASMAWQDFRHSNLVSTSTPQARSGGEDDSDGAEEDGFVGTHPTHPNSPQEVMMEIMDKYVLAGEALAEKENDVRQLRKEMEMAKAANSDLQTRLSHLTTANEKLADDEGRWYSLARELENQMDVIKKGETYSLFQDKVDEAEARLEVAADASHTCRTRLFEVYGEINADFKVNDNDGGDGHVDEHRQHATMLEELRHLKSVAKDNKEALDASRDAHSSAESAKQEQAQEAELRRRLEGQVSQLQEEAVAREEAAQSGQDALREASAKQSQELQQALQALSAAETLAKAAEDAKQIAVVGANTSEAKVASVLEDLKLAHEETQRAERHLAETRGELETAQDEVRQKDEERALAEDRIQDLSSRVAKLENDLADSSQKIVELTQVAQVCQGEFAEATAKSTKLQALSDMQEMRHVEASERIAELSDTLQAVRSQLDDKEDAVRRAQSEAEKALEDCSMLAERAEGLRQELERVAAGASTAEQEHAAHAEVMSKEIERIAADAAGAEEHATRVQELRDELESTRLKAAAAAEENAIRADEVCRELEAANSAATSATEENEVLRQEIKRANAAVALAEQKSTAHVEKLRQDLDTATTALVAAQNSESACRQELERATSALADAEDEMARVNEARRTAEAKAERAEKVRGDAETQVEALRQMGVAQGGGTFTIVEHDAAATTHALQEAREDALRAETSLKSTNQACEELRQHAAKQADEVRGLEAQLSEARASLTQLEQISQEQREALRNSGTRVNQLEQRLAALQVELDEKMTVLTLAGDEPVGQTRSGSAGNRIEKTTLSANPLDDEGEEGTAKANGVTHAFKTAEAEELHAHAEAMELELRYTLESFEGQLSAMAREKVAIQKQVKELSGQCTTLRKQVSHYKKVARESEAQVEQVSMLELQQQLCDAERTAEAVRADNSSLRSTNHDLKAELEVVQADSANKSQERMWRQSQVWPFVGVGSTAIKLCSKYLKTSRVESTLLLKLIVKYGISACSSRWFSLKSASLKWRAIRTTFTSMQDDLMELQTRLVRSEENFAAKSQELAAKAQEETSARALVTTLEQRLQEAESEVSELNENFRFTAEQLSSALSSAEDLRCDLSKVSELENSVGDLEAEKLRLEEMTAALTGQLEQARNKLEELQESIRSFEEEKVKMSHAVQEAEEGRAALVMEMGHIATIVGCDDIYAEGATTSLPGISGAITALKEKLTAAEELLGATAQVLLRTIVEGEIEIDSASRWIIDGVNSLQHRLQVAELELSQRAEIQGGEGLRGETKLLENLSGMLECDGDRIIHEVHELKNLAHDLSELREKHLNEIRHLKNESTRDNSISTSSSSTTNQDLVEGELPSRSEQAVIFQVTASSSDDKLSGAQDISGKETKESHRKEGQKGSEVFSGFIERTNGSEAKHPCVHDKRRSSHRGSRSSQPGAPSTHGMLPELDKQRPEVKLHGGAEVRDDTVTGATSTGRKGSFEASDACGELSVSQGTAEALATSGRPSESKSALLLAEIQEMLGCTKDEVIGVLIEQQAAIEREKMTYRILGDLKQTCLNGMENLASAIGHEATRKVSPLLTQASELWSFETCHPSNREGLEVLHKATVILTSFVSESTAANADMAKAALRQSQEQVATLNETLRKERLMMMAFRRWGHFYLALSNEALRKRTKEQNQARSQRDDPENASLSIIQGPRTERGRSRRSLSAGRRNCGRGRLQLSSSEVQVMVEQEAESVARELAAEPSMSLIALADARKEMDEIAMKAQATLGVLYTQTPLTHDANVATDEISALEIVGKLPDGKATGEIVEVSPPPTRPSGTFKDISSYEKVALPADAMRASGSDEIILAPPTPPPMPTDEQHPESEGVLNKAELPEEDGTASRSDADEGIPSPPTRLSPSPSLATPPTGLPNEVHGSKASDETGTSHGSGEHVLLTNALPGRTTGPLVENGISKKERVDFLRRQREERKANRKRGMQAAASRAKPVESSGNLGVRNRRTSAPAIMPSTTTPSTTTDVSPGFIAPRAPATPSRKTHTSSESGSAQNSTIAVEDDGAGKSGLSTAGLLTTTDQEHNGLSRGIPAHAGSPPAGDAVALSAASRAPPPRMFNPTAVPPPVAPPSLAPSSHAQQSRHPSMAFNVNETVERALTEARRDAGVAQRKAAFWRCRFRDLAVWATSFVLLAYASDHGFDDC
ncbi:unnamed protein product [Scytosiphon promiscuus]